MSELKDYSILDIEAIDDERHKTESAPGKWVPESRVYLKSEADKVIAELKARIAELEEERRWRKCSEELPEEGVEVLVTNGIDCGISDWCGDYWNNDPFCGYTVCDNVIAWMPLPKVRKEGK